MTVTKNVILFSKYSHNFPVERVFEKISKVSNASKIEIRHVIFFIINENPKFVTLVRTFEILFAHNSDFENPLSEVIISSRFRYVFQIITLILRNFILSKKKLA